MLICGIFVGIAAILPGISGGVLTVIFGIYQPLMEVLAHPFKKAKQYLNMLVPFAIGGVVGFIGFAKVVSFLLAQNSGYTLSVFLGLTLGMFPSIFQEAGSRGRNKNAIIGFIGSFMLFLCLLLFLKTHQINLPTNLFTYFLCGIAWGLSIIVPGMSSSATLIFLGLYQPMTDGIAAFNLEVLIPLAVGFMMTLLSLSKLVHVLFEKHYTGMYHIILGIVVSSTVLTIPTHFESQFDLWMNILCVLLGFLFTLVWETFAKKIQKKVV